MTSDEDFAKELGELLKKYDIDAEIFMLSEEMLDEYSKDKKVIDLDALSDDEFKKYYAGELSWPDGWKWTGEKIDE